MREEDWFRQLQLRAEARRPLPNPVWARIVVAYRATGNARPSQLEVAERLDISESTLRRWLRGLAIERWSDVHKRVDAAK